MLPKMLPVLLIIVLLLSPLHLTAQTIPLPTDLEVITPENAHRLVEVARIGNGVRLQTVDSPDGSQKAIASTVGVWMGTQDAPPHLLPGHRGLAQQVAFSNNGLLLASGDEHGTVFLWHGVSGELLRRFPSDLGEIGRVEFSPNQNFIVAGNNFGSIIVWKISTGEIFRRHYSQGIVLGRLADIMFSPNMKYLAWIVIYPYCCGDFVQEPVIGNDAWQVMDIETGQLLEDSDSFSTFNDDYQLFEYAVVPSNIAIAMPDTGDSASIQYNITITYSNGDVEQWKLETGSLSRLSFISNENGASIMEEQRERIDRIYSHDRTKFATVSGSLYGPGVGGIANHLLTLWDTESNQQISTLWEALPFDPMQNEAPTVFSLQFSPDDRLLAAGYGACMAMGCSGTRWYYGFIQIWDVETQEELVKIDGHKMQVISILFTPDGKLLITGSRDGTVRFWGVPSEN